MTKDEIETVLDNFERFMENNAKRHPSWQVRCIICNHPARREFNRGLLTGELRDNALAQMLGLNLGSVRQHRMLCLPKRGDAPIDVVDRLEAHRRKRYPTLGKPWSQKQWLLEELTYLRDVEMRKPKPDYKHILKLAKEIDVAADAYNAARAKNAAGKSKPKGNGLDEDLNAEQIVEMSKVKSTNNGGA